MVGRVASDERPAASVASVLASDERSFIMVERRAITVVAGPATIETGSFSSEVPGPTAAGHAIVAYSPSIMRTASATFAIVAADTMPSGFPRRRADAVRVCSPMT